MRRKLQRISKERVLFLDETAVRLSEAPTRTLVLPGEQRYVLATDTTSYAKRFDMIACISGKQVFAPVIYTPKDRSAAGVKGINTEMLVDYILSTLGQETAALDNPPLTLVLDRARIHNLDRVREAFNERGGHVVYYELMPAMAAKRLSPLDNALFHEWKEAIRKRGPLTLRNMEQVMADEWNHITTQQITRHYKHCGLMRGAARTCTPTALRPPHMSTAAKQTLGTPLFCAFVLSPLCHLRNQTPLVYNFITQCITVVDEDTVRLTPRACASPP
jgi:hypothetical protein